MSFRIGDNVEWTATSGGKRKTYRGRIVGTVRRATNVEAAPAYHRLYPSHDLRIGVGGERDHTSYLVEGDKPRPGRARLPLYWPVVSGLRKVA